MRIWTQDDVLEKELENWRRGTASLKDIITLSRELGEQRHIPGIPALVEFLDHEDEIVRYNAAMSLGFNFEHRPATDKLAVMLCNDPDEDVRDVAAGALRVLWADSKNADILTVLAKAALNDPDQDVRKAAYLALIIVNGVSREEHLKLIMRERSPVDAACVESIMAQMRA